MDIGELEIGGKDKSRQPVLGKSRSLKEAARSEAAAEGASKPVRMGPGCSRVGVLWEEGSWGCCRAELVPTTSSHPGARGCAPSARR